MTTLPEPLPVWLRSASHIVVLTGAGISAESGIATFRDADHGLWARFDPGRLATEAGFRADPDLVWAWYAWRMTTVRAAQPNAGHHAIAALARRQADVTVITQNVDDLHERAGSDGVLHLHGELFAPRCADCAAPHTEPPAYSMVPVLRQAPPRCGRCGGPVRPGVVWFGETLPERTWRAAETAIRHCDLLFVVGTSGCVQPAALLPGLARRAGARVIEINPAATMLSGDADCCWRAPAASALPRLLAAGA